MESLLYSEKEEGELSGLKHQLMFFPDKDKSNCIYLGQEARILGHKLETFGDIYIT